MEPITVLLSSAIALVDWKKIAKTLATDEATKGAKSLLRYFQPTDQEKNAKRAAELFLKEFLNELEDKSPLTLALPGYGDQLKTFIEFVASDLAAFLHPNTQAIDLQPIADRWRWLGLDALPEDFDWELVARNFSREIRGWMRKDPALQAQLSLALQEEQTELQKSLLQTANRIAGPAPGFDLEKYRTYLRQKCGALQLSVMHSSAYDRRMTLGSVFVPQSARQSTPVRDIPRQLLRQLREENQFDGEWLQEALHDEEVEPRRSVYRESPSLPILEILSRERLVVVLGDPGSGKTSLLKYLVLRWLESPADEILPLWIDIKEYVQTSPGILQYCERSFTTFGIDVDTIR